MTPNTSANRLRFCVIRRSALVPATCPNGRPSEGVAAAAIAWPAGSGPSEATRTSARSATRPIPSTEAAMRLVGAAARTDDSSREGPADGAGDPDVRSRLVALRAKLEGSDLPPTDMVRRVGLGAGSNAGASD